MFWFPVSFFLYFSTIVVRKSIIDEIGNNANRIILSAKRDCGNEISAKDKVLKNKMKILQDQRRLLINNNNNVETSFGSRKIKSKVYLKQQACECPPTVFLNGAREKRFPKNLRPHRRNRPHNNNNNSSQDYVVTVNSVIIIIVISYY